MLSDVPSTRIIFDGQKTPAYTTLILLSGLSKTRLAPRCLSKSEDNLFLIIPVFLPSEDGARNTGIHGFLKLLS